MATVAQTAPSIEAAINRFRRLPYKDWPYSQRSWGHPFHSLCSYPSKMKPSMAHFLIKEFTQPGEVVVDPFSGVGTIPFEASLAGRRAVGTDLNPLAWVVTRAKLRPPSRGAIERCLPVLAEAARAGAAIDDVPAEIVSFYHPDTLTEMTAVRSALLGLLESPDVDQQDAAFFLLACLSHIAHGNRPYALSRRSHNVIPIRPDGPFEYKPVVAHLHDKVDRALAAGLPDSFLPGDAEQCPAEATSERTADAVITSPPFLGSTHFVRQNRIRLWLCGWDYAQQEGEKPAFLEHQKTLDPYEAIFEAFSGCLKPGGLCILHLGVVRTVDMARSLAPIAERHGLSVVDVIYEDAGHLETHGRSDRGGTGYHQFLFLEKAAV